MTGRKLTPRNLQSIWLLSGVSFWILTYLLTPPVRAEDAVEALVQASRTGNVSRLKVLLAEGTDVNAESENGDFALLVASRQGRTDVVRSLVAAGAEAGKEDRFGLTPLVSAAANGHTDIVRLLLKAGADPDDRPAPYAEGPLMVAVWEGHTETVRVLLDGGADVNTRSGAAMTWLTLARAPAADLQEQIERGRTALMVAVSRGHVETVRALLEQGAEVNAKDGGGQTALDLASAEDQQAIGELLREAGAAGTSHGSKRK